MLFLIFSFPIPCFGSFSVILQQFKFSLGICDKKLIKSLFKRSIGQIPQDKSGESIAWGRNAAAIRNLGRVHIEISSPWLWREEYPVHVSAECQRNPAGELAPKYSLFIPEQESLPRNAVGFFCFQLFFFCPQVSKCHQTLATPPTAGDCLRSHPIPFRAEVKSPQPAKHE